MQYHLNSERFTKWRMFANKAMKIGLRCPLTTETGPQRALMQSAIDQMARRRAHPPALKAFALKDVADAHRFLGSPDLLGKIALVP